MKVEKIDVFRMNLEECAAHSDFKLSNTRGMGEKRIYVGSDKNKLDSFFDFDNIKCFFMYKSDLLKYLDNAKVEYYTPRQKYKKDLSMLYKDKEKKIQTLENDRIELNFTSKFDKQKRYYLNFAKDKYSRKNWSYLIDIAIPRYTKLDFLKIRDVDTKELYIYIKPVFLITLPHEVEPEIIKIKELNGKKKNGYRPYQEKFRMGVLERMPVCVFTGVSEDRILQACHIKSDEVCNDKECKDPKNGITMTPTYHLLFDNGLISFKNDGTVLVSEYLSNYNRAKLDLDKKRKCVIPGDCSIYLEYHREHIFSSVNKDITIVK